MSVLSAGLSRNQQIIGLFAWLLLSVVTAAIGSAASIQAAPFYAELIRPDWAPPAWLFGPVWTVLYALMAIAAWLVWRIDGFGANSGSRARMALLLFIAQLIANALWSWLFFYWRDSALAFVDIVLLWLLIAATLVMFWRITPAAGVLLVPYLLWVSFAAALNYSLWQLNPS